MDLSLWLAFAAASAALLLIPGPTVVLVLSYALSQGRRVAVATALGLAAGDFMALTLALAGLGALVATSATAFTLLKWIGAAYLFWLGWRMLRTAPQIGLPGASSNAPPEAPPVAPSAVFRHALLVTALNPKAIAFFAAFVPHFIQAESALLPQASVIVATFVGLAALNALAYALLADWLRTRLVRPAAVRLFARAGGMALMTMGLATALIRRSPA